MADRRAQQIDRAHALRAEGAALSEIAAALTVSPRTVSRWLNPGATERSRERSRTAKQARRRPCERCSEPLSYDRAGGLCASCRRDDAHERIERVAKLYGQGHEPPEIARTVGISEGYARNILGELARGDRIEPRWTLRDRRSVRERERQVLALKAQGQSRPQIAQRVRVTYGSLSTVLARLSESGRGEAARSAG